MKGIVFTEFFEMVESRFGDEMVDHIITAAELPNDGAYTAVGTYEHQEMVRLVTALSEQTGTAVPLLLRTFGEFLFDRLAQGYPAFLNGVGNSFEFLKRVDSVIHIEVRKLYPDAELPRFDYESIESDNMVIRYRSPRGLADLAEGLIRGCAAHFNETVDIAREDLSDGTGRDVRFTISRRMAA